LNKSTSGEAGTVQGAYDMTPVDLAAEDWLLKAQPAKMWLEKKLRRR